MTLGLIERFDKGIIYQNGGRIQLNHKRIMPTLGSVTVGVLGYLVKVRGRTHN